MKKSAYEFEEVYKLSSQIEEASEQARFKDVLTNENGGVTLVGIMHGQKIADHLAPGDVLVYMVGGEVEFTFKDKKRTIGRGDFMLIEQGVSHSVEAKADSKIMLVKIKS